MVIPGQAVLGQAILVALLRLMAELALLREASVGAQHPVLVGQVRLVVALVVLEGGFPALLLRLLEE